MKLTLHFKTGCPPCGGLFLVKFTDEEFLQVAEHRSGDNWGEVGQFLSTRRKSEYWAHIPQNTNRIEP